MENGIKVRAYCPVGKSEKGKLASIDICAIGAVYSANLHGVFREWECGCEDCGFKWSCEFCSVFRGEPRFFRRQLVEVVGSMLQKIVEAESLEEGTRHLAIEFVITLAEARERAPGMMRKLPQFITRLFGILMKMLLDIEDEAAWHTPENEDEAAGESSNYSVYCVRSSPTNAIGQLATDLGPDLQLQFHQRVLPALAGAMDDFHNPRVQPRTIEIEETLVEAATKGLHDRLPSPLQRLRWLSENLVEVTGTTESVSSLRIKVRAYCPVGKSEKGKLASSMSVKSIELYIKYFSMPYTLPKLDMVAVPDFSAAANTQRLSIVVTHEVGHQWFGNLVTLSMAQPGFCNIGKSYLATYSFFPEWKIWTEFLEETAGGLLLKSNFYLLNLCILFGSEYQLFFPVASTNGKMDRMLQIYFIEIIVRLRKGRRWWLRIMDLFLRRLSLATTTVCEEFSGVPDHSPESFVTALIAKTSPEAFTEVGGGKRVCLGRIDGRSKITGCSGRVKDYVMECIGSEIKQRPKSEWITADASSSAVQTGKSEKKKSEKRLDWWMSLDEEKNVKEPKRRPAREWWKEEYSDELVRKKKKKQGRESSTHNLNNNHWWQKYDEMYVDDRKKKRSRSTSRGSVDWWLDGFSGELWRARHNNHDYYSCGGDLSEKCYVHSFGVLLLVVIAGRRWWVPNVRIPTSDSIVCLQLHQTPSPLVRLLKGGNA
ncbi:receptor-like serine/threonine-protein kinase [Tanacetum coccineum]